MRAAEYDRSSAAGASKCRWDEQDKSGRAAKERFKALRFL